jgi:hypothetical protein
MEVLLDPEQGVGASARAVELDGGGKGELEQTAGSAPQSLVSGSG